MQQQFEVRIGNEEARGHYSNMMQIHSASEEFCLDFFNLFPPTGALVARIIVSPGHLKRMVRVLHDTLARYEKQFGGVEEAQEPDKPKIGFGS